METVTDRNVKSILVDGFHYSFYRTQKDGTDALRCTKRGCNAKWIGGGRKGVVHNHVEMPIRTEERKLLKNACKRKAENDISVRPSKVIRQCLPTMNDGNIVAKDLKCAAQAVYRARRKNYPTLPKSREELQEKLELVDTLTNRGEEFLFANDEEKGIVMFTTERNLVFLGQEGVKLFADGTFKVCPKYFLQLYIIHGWKGGFYVPLVYFLLPGKSEEMYRTTLTMLVDKCNEHQVDLDAINSISLDFELAMHNAVRAMFPTWTIVGCKFHLGQSFFRKIQKLGLADQYKNKDSQFGKWLIHFHGLSFLDPQDVKTCFVEDFVAEAPEEAAARRGWEFSDYVLENYIRVSNFVFSYT